MMRLDDGAAQLERLKPPGWQKGESQQTAEKDRAVALARSVARSPVNLAPDDAAVLARQFLRALGLPA